MPQLYIFYSLETSIIKNMYKNAAPIRHRRKVRYEKYDRQISFSYICKKVDKNKSSIEKYGFWGLVLFVGIPLPGTGAWTNAMVAGMLEMDRKKALLAITLGVFVASIIMMIISFGIINKIAA